MNARETAMLCKFVQALCPSQKFDEYTPDAWHEVLSHIPSGVARKAAGEVARRHRYVAPSDILTAAHRMRAAVRAQVERETDRTEVGPDDGRGYITWRQQQRDLAIAETDRRIAAGVYDLAGLDLTGELFGDPSTPELRRIDGRTVPALTSAPEPPANPEVVAIARRLALSSRIATDQTGA